MPATRSAFTALGCAALILGIALAFSSSVDEKNQLVDLISALSVSLAGVGLTVGAVAHRPDPPRLVPPPCSRAAVLATVPLTDPS